jgi:hypothetical protein
VVQEDALPALVSMLDDGYDGLGLRDDERRAFTSIALHALSLICIDSVPLRARAQQLNSVSVPVSLCVCVFVCVFECVS